VFRQKKKKKGKKEENNILSLQKKSNCETEKCVIIQCSQTLDMCYAA